MDFNMRLFSIFTIVLTVFLFSSQNALACSPLDDAGRRLNSQIIAIDKSAPRGATVKFYIENRFAFDLCRVEDAPFGAYASNRYLSLALIDKSSQIPARIPRATVAEAVYRFEYPSEFTQIPAANIPVGANTIYKAGTDISNSCAIDEPPITSAEANLQAGEVVELALGLIVTYRPCEAGLGLGGSAGSLSSNHDSGEYRAAPGLSIRAIVTPEFELISPR